jgi:flagellar protein FlaG
MQLEHPILHGLIKGKNTQGDDMSVETIAVGTANTALTSIEAKPVVTQQPTPPVPAVTKTDTTVVKQDELASSLEQIQVMMDLRSRAVEFTTDEVRGTQVVKVVDANSGDVIRQMPAEELLSFMRNLTRMLGTFIDKST